MVLSTPAKGSKLSLCSLYRHRFPSTYSLLQGVKIELIFTLQALVSEYILSTPGGRNGAYFHSTGIVLHLRYATSGTFAHGQVSCPNMAILKIGPYLENFCLQSENKLNCDPMVYPDRKYMCNFWNMAIDQVSCPNTVILEIGPYYTKTKGQIFVHFTLRNHFCETSQSCEKCTE